MMNQVPKPETVDTKCHIHNRSFVVVAHVAYPLRPPPIRLELHCGQCPRQPSSTESCTLSIARFQPLVHPIEWEIQQEANQHALSQNNDQFIVVVLPELENAGGEHQDDCE